MSSIDSHEKDPLPGTIVKIPLYIEDKSSGETIKQCQLWLHVSKAEFQPSNDPQFSNISITAVYQDGYFHTVVTKSNLSKLFRSNASVNIEPEDYYHVFINLFPLDLEGLIESFESEGDHKRLKLSAKLLANKSDYDENGELLDLEDEDPNKTSITIMIKTDAKLSVTVGSFELKAIEFEKQEHLQDESDLFNWLDVYNFQNQALLDSLQASKLKIEKLKDENYLLENNYNESKNDFKNIIVDMELRFYQVLDSKKDLIWDLTKNRHPKDKLENLNQDFLDNEGKLNVINREEIPSVVDSKYEKKRKASTSKKGVSKKRKTRKTKPVKGKESKLIESEERSSQEHTSDDGHDEYGSTEEAPPAARTRHRIGKVETSDNEETFPSKVRGTKHEDDVMGSSDEELKVEQSEPRRANHTVVKEEPDSHPLGEDLGETSERQAPKRSFRERASSQPKIKLEKDLLYSIPLRSDREIVNSVFQGNEDDEHEQEESKQTNGATEDESNQDSYNEEEDANAPLTDHDGDDEEEDESAVHNADDDAQDTLQDTQPLGGKNNGSQNSSVIEDSLHDNKEEDSINARSQKNADEETDYSSSSEDGNDELITNSSSKPMGKHDSKIKSQTPMSQHDHETDYSSDD